MRLHLRSAFLALATAATLSSSALAFTMDEEINHLLDAISASPCTFIRNGVSYDGRAAVEHIRMKYEYYRLEIHSTDDFIALAATKSMMSGRPYLVQCGAQSMPAADWLKRELAAFRQHS